MSERDYYEVLGVNKDDDTKIIKKAYKRLAMKHHPDRNKNNKGPLSGLFVVFVAVRVMFHC